MVACGISYPDKDFSGWVTFPVTTVTLRSGPSNSCIQTGQGIPGQRADYFCYAPGDGGTWTFLRTFPPETKAGSRRPASRQRQPSVLRTEPAASGCQRGMTQH
jgi:hypothetical protein